MQYTKEKKLEKLSANVRKIYAWVGFVTIILAVPTLVYVIIKLIK